MRNTHYRTLNMSRKLTNEENEKNMVGTEIWQETWKNVQNEKHTLQDLDCGEKTEKRGKCHTHTQQDLEYGKNPEKGGK